MRSQRGQAMLLTVLLVGVGVSAIIFNFVTPGRDQARRDATTSAAMADAKAALIGFAAANQTRPGLLPCPDTNNDGLAEAYVADECPSYTGRLPWRTLGLPDLRDGAGERLWYAVTRDFARNQTGCIPASSCALNPDTPGQFTITGSFSAAGVIALVFSPGEVLGTQDRSAANIDTITHYLDGDNNNGDNTFTTALPGTAFNDRILTITNDNLFQVVNIRVAKQAIAAIATYVAANKKYPYANAYGSADPYDCSAGLYRGRLPSTTTCSGLPPFAALPAWFRDNKWTEVTHYAASTNVCMAFVSLGSSVDTELSLVCAGSGELSPALVNTLITLGVFTAGGEISGTGSTGTVRALVIVSGQARPGQVHPCVGAADCLEDAANTNGDAAYVKPSRFPASNDRMVVTCGSTPCATLP